MTRKAITLKFVVPTAVGILLIGAVYLKDKYFPIDQAEADHSVAGSGGIDALPHSYARFSRIHMLLSSMK